MTPADAALYPPHNQLVSLGWALVMLGLPVLYVLLRRWACPTWSSRHE